MAAVDDWGDCKASYTAGITIWSSVNSYIYSEIYILDDLRLSGYLGMPKFFKTVNIWMDYRFTALIFNENAWKWLNFNKINSDFTTTDYKNGHFENSLLKQNRMFSDLWIFGIPYYVRNGNSLCVGGSDSNFDHLNSWKIVKTRVFLRMCRVDAL